MLKEMTIRSLANEVAYQRGCRYFQKGAVLDLARAEGQPSAYVAKVQGSEVYDVSVQLSRSGSSIESFACDCPAAVTYLGACKHTVAVLKAIQAQQEQEGAGRTEPAMTSRAGARMLSLFSSAAQQKAPQAARQRLSLEPTLFIVEHYAATSLWLEFRIGESRMYMVKDVRALLRDVDNGMDVPFGKSLTVMARSLGFADAASAGLWQLLSEAYREERSVAMRRGFSWGTETVHFDKKRFYLSPRFFERFMEVMDGTPFALLAEDGSYPGMRTLAERPRLALRVSDSGDGARVVMDAGGWQALGDHYLRRGDTFYRVDEDFMRGVRPLLESFQHAEEIQLDARDTGIFFGEVLPQLEQVASVAVDGSFQEKFLLEPLQAELYLDYHGDGIEARPSFGYGELRFNPLLHADPPGQAGKILVRDRAGERAFLSWFDAYGFERRGGTFLQPDEEKSYDFLVEALPQLAERADVFYADAFQKKPVQRMAKVTAGVSVNDENLLEVTFSARDVNFDELMDILAAYRQKRRYHRLKDGTFVTLEQQQLSALADLVESTGIRRGKAPAAADGDMTVKLPLSQAMYLDALAKEEDSLHLERSQRFRAVVRDLRHPDDADVEVPKPLQKVLRDYQRTGFRWLMTLAQYGLGGILADDMGLGKTLQVISFLLAKRGASPHPALVVAPTSLMYNWLDEIARFAPELRAAAVAGTKQERESALAEGQQSDVLITTYNMLKRDIDLYEKRRFSYCFLDEAQHIKNPATQNAKAVKRLDTGGYFALTGTPIENTLTELWSIFDFLMPGYLGTHAKFKQRYETPIVRAEDEHAARDLRRHVMPFILRRMKKDVLKELPDKVESRMVNEMTPKQEKVYQAYFIQGQKEFAAALKAHGFGESRIKILAILTRLRQIACDPALFLEDYEGGSGKLDMLEEVVGEAVAAGHRLLIFSQFTTMLQHIAARLREMKLAYAYLDGQTPALERLRLVKEFNAGAAPVFLISLKAGGTGLNLTGADMVIHYDPWWNPAVEDQATDRAYRLGQQRNVQVLKFITKDTIEEKIYKLQEKKKSLIDQMIQPGENFLSKLTEDEIRDLFRR